MMRDEPEDKRRAAFHEAGHITVGIAYDVWGCDATIRFDSERARWDGNCDYDETSGRGRCVHGMGGATGEWLAVQSECTPDDVIDAISRGAVVVSESDRAACPTDQARTAAIRKSHRLLVKYGSFLAWAANRLIDEQFLSTDEARAEFVRRFPGEVPESDD